MRLGLGLGITRQGGVLFPLGDYTPTGAAPPALVADIAEAKYYNQGSPQTFSNIFTATRSTNATVMDVDGLIKWRPHNLLTYSQDFSNAAWVKNAQGIGAVPVVTANAAAAPDGSYTADRVVCDLQGGTSTSDYSLLSRSGSTISTLGIWLRTADGTSQTIHVRNGASSLQAVTITGDWTFVARANPSTSDTTLFIGLRGGVGVDDTADFYIWGAHLYRSDLGGMQVNPDTGNSYVPTTSSALYLAGFDYSTGSRSLLIEPARTNLLDYSFGTGTAAAPTGWSWLGAGSGEVTATLTNGTVGYTTSSDRYLRRAITLTAVPHTLTVYIEPGATYEGQVIAANGFVGATGDLNATTTEADENGRVSITFTPDAGDLNGEIRIGCIQAMAGTVSFAGWQLEVGGFSTSLIPTAGATVARAADTLQIDSAKGLWPEPVVISDELCDLSDNTSGNIAVSGEVVSRQTATVSETIDLSAPVSSLGLSNGDVVRVTGTLSNYNSGAGVEGVGWSSLSCFAGLLLGQRVFRFGAGDFDKILVVQDATKPLKVGYVDTTLADISNLSVQKINPIGISIQIEGTMNYADNGIAGEVVFLSWRADADNLIELKVDTTTTLTGRYTIVQRESAVSDFVTSSDTYFSPGVGVPFNIASRHGATFVGGAIDGTALTADLTPTGFPALAGTNLQIGPTFCGRVSKIVVWHSDIGDAGIAEVTS